MTKLIALVGVLAALAWGITATANWITARKAPRALPAGTTPRPLMTSEVKKSILTAQFKVLAAAAFTLIMFASLFRVSVGLSGHLALTAIYTAGLSASGGLLLFTALPAKKAAHPTASLLPPWMILLPAGSLILLLAAVVWGGLVEPQVLAWRHGVPTLLAALALAGSALLSLRRLATCHSLPDPRMASPDLHWRQLGAKSLSHFTSGSLLASLGTFAMVAATANATPALLVAGTAVAAAGVVFLSLAVKGTLTARRQVLAGGTPSTQ